MSMYETNIESFYKMKLFQKIEYKYFSVICVPGGWIFTPYDGTSVYVENKSVGSNDSVLLQEDSPLMEYEWTRTGDKLNV